MRVDRRPHRAGRGRVVRRRAPLDRAGTVAGVVEVGVEPVLDLGMRLGEGSGAVAAVPVLRSAVAVLRDVALLDDLGPSNSDA